MWLLGGSVKTAPSDGGKRITKASSDGNLLAKPGRVVPTGEVRKLKIDMTPPPPSPQASGGNAHGHVLAQTHPPPGSAGFGSTPRASYDDDQVPLGSQDAINRTSTVVGLGSGKSQATKAKGSHRPGEAKEEGQTQTPAVRSGAASAKTGSSQDSPSVNPFIPPPLLL